MKTYEGPVSDHFDGTRFFDPDGCRRNHWPRCCAGIRHRRKRATGRIGSECAQRYAPPRVSGDKVRLSFVGHVTWLIQTADLNISSILCGRCGPRRFPLRAAPAQRSRHRLRRAAQDRCRAGVATAITTISTSRRYQNCRQSFRARDHATRQRRHHARYGCCDQSRRVRWQDRVELGNGITAQRTRHWSARGLLTNRNKALWASFVFGDAAANSTSSAIQAMAKASISVAVGEKHGPLRLQYCRIGAYDPRWFMKTST